VLEARDTEDPDALAATADTARAGVGEPPSTTPGCPNWPVARAVCAATTLLRAAALPAALRGAA